MKKIYAMIVMMAMTLTASAQEAEVASPYDNGLSVKIAAEADKFTLTARDQEPLTIAIPKQARPDASPKIVGLVDVTKAIKD